MRKINEKIISLIAEITAKVIELNSISEHDFFVSFSGHVNLINVYYIKGGHKKDEKNERVDLIDEYSITYRKEENLKRVIETLDKLLIEEKSK